MFVYMMIDDEVYTSYVSLITTTTKGDFKKSIYIWNVYQNQSHSSESFQHSNPHTRFWEEVLIVTCTCPR